MSQPSRPQAQGPAQRRRREHRIETIQALEERQLLAPVLSSGAAKTVTFTAATTPTNTFLGTVTVTPGTAAATATSAQPVTSVSELTPISSFGGDIVRIKAGPGGDFGKGVYAISRGAGDNATNPLTGRSAINRPGVIYRVDPATGKTSVFFDLNTVLNQLEPDGSGMNSVGKTSGLVNFYDLAFDPEGYFDGHPSLFVSSVDRSDPNKNVIYQIGPDGSFKGAFVQFSQGQSALKFNVNPTAILVPPPEDQTFLRGLIAGTGSSTSLSPGSFSALFFDANAYRPGQNISNANLPNGVVQTNLFFGPQVGLTAANPDYLSRVYSVFTDFGTPAAGGIPARTGLSGVQGLNGELLLPAQAFTAAGVLTTPIDTIGAAPSNFRRFEDIAFDQYGYFSQGFSVKTPTVPAGTTTTAPTFLSPFTSTIGAPTYAGSLFVADLATGLSVSATPLAPLATTPVTLPVQGDEIIGFNANGSPRITVTNPLGGRIIRITPAGVVTPFAEGFNTSSDFGSTSFVNSSLTISFSADGTTLYASDDDGIWQFKTTTSLASSTSGSIIGLNDLRSLGVPYEGQDSAVAIVDTGVDTNSTPFRGRVSTGTNIITNGFGNNDTAAGTSTGTATTTANNTGGGLTTGPDGHGTLVAGVVAQFVPQATIEPVDIFYPFLTALGTTTTGGGTGGGANGTVVTANANAVSTNDVVYKGLSYVASHPFVNDPIRPNKTDRVIASTLGFGSTETFDSEGSAFRRYSQVIISFKNQLKKFRSLGIAPIAATGQFGAPFGAGATTGTGGNTGTTGTTGRGHNNSENKSVGDVTGIALPAILNEVISVTGTYPFPFQTGPAALPTNPPIGVVGNLPAPVLIGQGIGTTGATTTTTTTSTTGGQLGVLTAGDIFPFSDRIIAAANRNVTTDFAAPALDIPTFRRTFLQTTTGTTTTNTIDPNDHNTFNQGGTSLSAGIVTGAYALVSSALNYWTKLRESNGYTVDAYLTQPVGVRSLNFGPHAFMDLSAYNNPDGINAILQWTAVPVRDTNDGLSGSTPPRLFGSTDYRSFSRIDVGNAIAAIEGRIALQYLLDHNIFPIIDGNHNGIITPQEIQEFVDNSAKIGLPEAGAMARLLGGTARIPDNSFTLFGETPDQPDVLQRRFNFFDFAADGQLNGSITTNQLIQMAHTLLPFPDTFVVNDRQRSSVNGYLLDPTAVRNFHDLQHIQPKYQFVPKSAFLKYRGISPARFKVNIDRVPSASTFPVYTLFDGPQGSGGNAQAQTAAHLATITNAVAPAAPAVTTSNTLNSQAPMVANTPAPSLAQVNTSANTTVQTPALSTPNPAETPGQAFIDSARQLAAQANGGTSQPLPNVGASQPLPTIGNAGPTGTLTPVATPITTPTSQPISNPTTSNGSQNKVAHQASGLGGTNLASTQPKKSTSFFQNVSNSFKRTFHL